MERFGLLGRKLGHSFSPRIHRELGEYPYELMEREAEELPRFLEERDFRGINVTIPWKQAVMPFLDGISERAKRIGAVNTIVKDDEGRLTGYNTDWDGFMALMDGIGFQPEGKKCLVLGSGGASKTVTACLEARGAGEIRIISRKGPDDYEHLDRHRDAAFIVNATPVGMYPENGTSPVELRRFPALEGVADLIYNPGRTALLLQAERLGIPHVNGLRMLVAQAKRASELFRGVTIPESETDRITALLEREMTNIVLIGMPGSGKSSVGRILAEKTGRPFVDTDEMIEMRTGKSCEAYILERGEAAFRRVESEVIREAGKRTGCILATGGGAVTRPENRDPLRQNGRLFHLDRPLEALDRKNRPLSATAEQAAQRYRERLPMYESWRDARIAGDTAEAAAEAILDIMEGKQQ
jgi:shikimate dehydrogenase